VSGEVWKEAARKDDASVLAGLVIAITNINVWSRLNIAVRLPAAEWKP
jgi:hypothetical protein